MGEFLHVPPSDQPYGERARPSSAAAHAGAAHPHQGSTHMVVRDAAPPALLHPHGPIQPSAPTAPPSPAPDPEPLHIEAAGVRRTVCVGRGPRPREVPLLRDVSFAIEPGELV